MAFVFLYAEARRTVDSAVSTERASLTSTVATSALVAGDDGTISPFL